jgi:hypothetical protein
VESDRTLAVVKHVLVDPPERQNGPYLEERSHLGGWRARFLCGCSRRSRTVACGAAGLSLCPARPAALQAFGLSWTAAVGGVQGDAGG